MLNLDLLATLVAMAMAHAPRGVVRAVSFDVRWFPPLPEEGDRGKTAWMIGDVVADYLVPEHTERKSW